MAKGITVLVVLLVASFGAGGIGSLFTMPAIPTWYADLNKPSWNPPSAVFGPVWSTLYAMMAVAGWLAWRKGAGATTWFWYGAQIVLNALWSWIFFGLKQPGWAFAEILFLWAAIVVTTVLFWRRSAAAGWLMVPYIAWVTFAAALNFTIWRLN